MKTKIKIDRLLLISKLEEIFATRSAEHESAISKYNKAMEDLNEKAFKALEKILSAKDMSGFELTNKWGTEISVRTGVEGEIPEHPNRYLSRSSNVEDIRKKIELLKLSNDLTILVSTDDEYYQYL